jgi:uncharacterized DUF497 family protein
MIHISLKITFDKAKRDRTFAERGLAFEDAIDVLKRRNFTVLDDRFDYGETRYQTYGMLNDRVVMIVWTPRDDFTHVISMRHCHDRESRKIHIHLDRSG